MKTKLSLRHPADTAAVTNALNKFQKVLAEAIPGKTTVFAIKTELNDVYAHLAAVHVSPRLEGERACVHCGCTDSHACPGGCAWSIKHKATPTGVCSRCVPKEIKLVDRL